MPSIAETATEMIQWVFPEHAGAPGQIHGGRMMEWITQVGTIAAARVARGTVALGSMDDLDFLHPVRVGEIAILRARVEELVQDLSDEHPVKRYAREQIELLDRLGHASSKAEEGGREPRTRIGWNEIPSAAPASDPLPRRE